MSTTTSDVVTIVCCAVMGILLVLLGANVTRHRARRGADAQMPSDPSDPLLIAQRAHGNAAEYVPTLMVLLLLCAVLSDSWWVPSLAAVALAARILHAAGILTSTSLTNHGPLRNAGALGTYLSGVAVGVTAIVVTVWPGR